MSGSTVTDPSVIARLLRETPIPVSKAALLLPPLRGKMRHASTLTRWCVTGKKGVRLEAYFTDGTWWTSEQALARFLATVTARELNGEVDGKPDEDWQRRADREQKEVLEKLRAGRRGKKRKG